MISLFLSIILIIVIFKLFNYLKRGSYAMLMIFDIVTLSMKCLNCNELSHELSIYLKSHKRLNYRVMQEFRISS